MAEPFRTINPRDLAAWRALCEHIEDWLTKSGPVSRRRSSIRTEEVAEEHRWLVATPIRLSRDISVRMPDGSLVPARVGNLCGLTQWQAREVQKVRSEYRLVGWGRAAGEGWSLKSWRERLAELESQGGQS